MFYVLYEHDLPRVDKNEINLFVYLLLPTHTCTSVCIVIIVYILTVFAYIIKMWKCEKPVVSFVWANVWIFYRLDFRKYLYFKPISLFQLGREM